MRSQWEVGETVDADAVPQEQTNDDVSHWSLPGGHIVAKRYRIVRELGRGGMGAVFEAFDVNLERSVAIKFLDPNLTKSPEAIQRFQLEAIAAGRIGHENICDVRDRGVTDEGMPFIVMERLEGEELNDLVHREERLAPELAVEIVLQVLGALAAAHEKGIVHRDLKPENIFLTEDSNGKLRVKLLDFGVSRFIGETASIRLTRTGNVIGTPSYMSPEQARGRADLDQRCDIWAVGVILFEALTGTPPFGGENYNEVIANILIEEPMPPGMLVPTISEPLEAVVMRALVKDPYERYASATEFAEDLHLALEYPDLEDWRAALSSGVAQPERAGLEESAGTPTSESTSSTTLEQVPEPSSPSVAVITPPGKTGRGLAIALAAGLSVAIIGVGALIAMSVYSGGDDEQVTEATTEQAESVRVLPATEVVPDETDVIAEPGAVVEIAGNAPEVVVVAPPESSPTVELQIRVEPESAQLAIDGVEVEGNPWAGRFPQDGLQHRIEASSPGYEKAARFVAFDQDREVELVLERAPAKQPRTPPRSQPRSQPRPRPNEHGKAPFDRDNPYGN